MTHPAFRDNLEMEITIGPLGFRSPRNIRRQVRGKLTARLPAKRDCARIRADNAREVASHAGSFDINRQSDLRTRLDSRPTFPRDEFQIRLLPSAARQR